MLTIKSRKAKLHKICNLSLSFGQCLTLSRFKCGIL